MTDSSPSPPRPKNPSATDCALTLVVIIALLAYGIPVASLFSLRLRVTRHRLTVTHE